MTSCETEFTQITLYGEHKFAELDLQALVGLCGVQIEHDNPIQTTFLWDLDDAEGVEVFDYRGEIAAAGSELRQCRSRRIRDAWRCYKDSPAAPKARQRHSTTMVQT